jgi:hypothetical protein
MTVEKIKFATWRDVRKISEGLDVKKPKLIKAGKEFDVYDWIQAAREDTEIYPTLEKYGSLKRMEIDVNTLYGDITEIKDLRDIHDMIKKSEEIWEGLPVEVRREFNHDKQRFMNEGEEWIKKLKDEQEKNKPVIITEPKENDNGEQE